MSALSSLSLVVGALSFGADASLSKPWAPSCKVIAPGMSPDSCDPSVSSFACYSLKAKYSPLDEPHLSIGVQWACLPGQDAGDMTAESCQNQSWVHEGGETPSGKDVGSVARDMYVGVCRLDPPAGEQQAPAQGRLPPAEGQQASPAPAPPTEHRTPQPARPRAGGPAAVHLAEGQQEEHAEVPHFYVVEHGGAGGLRARSGRAAAGLSLLCLSARLRLA
mmetsp:Transcript_53277/g.155197  ORF Transcript_53277/g.155197 Transcript_53277/m.155197 type:complete len:220 (+) Transcript_53277:58-717(+)